MTRASGPRAPGDRGQKDSIRGKVGETRKHLALLTRDLCRRRALCRNDRDVVALLDGFIEAVQRLDRAAGVEA